MKILQRVVAKVRDVVPFRLGPPWKECTCRPGAEISTSTGSHHDRTCPRYRVRRT